MAVDISMIKVHLYTEFNSYIVLNLCALLSMFYCIEDNNDIYILFEQRSMKWTRNLSFNLNFQIDIWMTHVDFKEWKIRFLLRSFKTSLYNYTTQGQVLTHIVWDKWWNWFEFILVFYYNNSCEVKFNHSNIKYKHQQH